MYYGQNKEDEIIQLLEAGNVSMPLTGTLITGSQSLMGIKTQLKFGINNSPMLRFPEIYDNPTINRQKEWNTDYKGMFDLVDSDGSGAGRYVAGSP